MKTYRKRIMNSKLNKIIMLFLVALFLYGSYRVFQEQVLKKEKISVQNNDLRYAFMIEDEAGNQTTSNIIPEGKDYKVEVDCTEGALGSWDRELWGPTITNLTTTRTKCKVIFHELPFFTDIIKELPAVTSGEGLYNVTHSNANITYTTNTSVINNLKQAELRFVGANPNNYVTFNEEIAGWRVIGLVNTPEGQRIKLIRDESIGNFSWDSSASSVNSGLGVNEWSKSDLKELLNSGAYYNRTSGNCYNDRNNGYVNCDFQNSGLTESAKSMIDTVTWNTGSNGPNVNHNEITTARFYNLERSSNLGKTCSGENSQCTDSVKRTTYWKGAVGLMYPSDYGYATSGGNETNRETCLTTVLGNWGDYIDCSNNNWLFKPKQSFVITPAHNPNNYANFVFKIGEATGGVGHGGVHNAYSVFPSVYLTSNVKILDGDGTKENPYILITE